MSEKGFFGLWGLFGGGEEREDILRQLGCLVGLCKFLEVRWHRGLSIGLACLLRNSP